MKKQLLLAFLLYSVVATAQTSLNGASGSIVEVYDAMGRPLTAKDRNAVTGSPMLNENWGTGTIKFHNGRTLQNASLRFNLFTNRLFYKVDELEFILVDPIDEFSFSYEENGKERSVLFRNGYPGTAPGGRELFYEVLSDGPRFQLLKRNYKTIQDFYDYSAAPAKTFRLASELFVFDAQLQTFTMIKIKQPLHESAPVLAAEIEKTGSPVGKFHSEKDLVDAMAKLKQ